MIIEDIKRPVQKLGDNNWKAWHKFIESKKIFVIGKSVFSYFHDKEGKILNIFVQPPYEEGDIYISAEIVLMIEFSDDSGKWCQSASVQGVQFLFLDDELNFNLILKGDSSDN